MSLDQPLTFRHDCAQRRLVAFVFHGDIHPSSTDLTTATAVLLQDYFDRWVIGVNHRDEKEIL